MNFLPLIAAVLPLATVPKLFFYIGTYTTEFGSKGIYRASLDPSTGKLSVPSLAAETSNPSYLAISPNGKNLYAANENDHGSASAFKIDPHQKLTFLNAQPVEGSAPCYISVDPTGKNVLVASYGVGYVSCLPLTPDGSLEKPSATIQTFGTGPDKSRQDRSHMHWIESNSTGKFVYTCDLGDDKVRVYKFEPKKGHLIEKIGETGHVPPGSGSRHGAFSPNLRFLYVNGEMGASVTAFQIDPLSGGLTSLETVPVFPDDDHEPGRSTAEIACHPSGKWLYVSNRGDDSISVFRILSSGKLEPIQVKKVGVKVPRGFGIDEKGQWLVVAGQGSDDLASFSIDPDSGKLDARSHVKTIGAPVCVVFEK
jgi:6-phosphogluconolactonase